MQVAMAKQIISMEGGSDVCSVCGENPAQGYKLERGLSSSAVGTPRLCDDCLEIRSMAGEQFVKL